MPIDQQFHRISCAVCYHDRIICGHVALWKGGTVLGLLATCTCLTIVAFTVSARRFALALGIDATRPRTSVALGALLIAAAVALFCLELVPYQGLYLGVWFAMLVAFTLVSGPSLRTALVANMGALCFMLAANLLHFGFLCLDASAPRTLLTHFILVAGALAAASVYLLALVRILEGARPRSEQADPVLRPLSVFAYFAIAYALLDLMPPESDMSFVFLPFTLLGSTLLVTVACGTFAFVATRLGAEALRESENRTLERKRKDQETRLRLYLAQASTDELTGLATRFAGQEQLDRLEETQSPYVLAFIDVDGLKKINDEQGHLYGDRYLAACAAALRTALPASTVVRWGGDEFLVIDESLDEAQMNACLARLEAEGTLKEPPIRFSFGVAAGSPGAITEALKRADVAMYNAKRDKRAAGTRAAEAAEGGAR